MLNRQELKRFYKAVLVIDEYFDINLFNNDKLDQIINLGEQLNLEGINVLMNKNDADTADELLEEFFNISIEKINLEAHSFEFDKIY